jgi:hypothetical protein
VLLDLHGPLADLKARDGACFAAFYRRHMTGPGNAFVAGPPCRGDPTG